MSDFDDQEQLDQEQLDQDPEELEDPIQEESEENETAETVLYIDNLTDYTGYFENLQTIGIFISALLVAYGLAFAFFKGFKK